MTYMTPEEWRPIPGWEDLYEVSDRGRVRSLDRHVVTSAGVVKSHKGTVLKAGMNRRHRHVALCRGDGGKSFRVHRLVMEAFVGPLPEGMEVRHLDDDPDNNSLSNLAYGTRSENMLDRVANGTHHQAAKTHCARGHGFTPENTLSRGNGAGRRCRQCKRDDGRASARAKRGKEYAQRCQVQTTMPAK